MAEQPIYFDDIINIGDSITKVIAEFKKLEQNAVKSIDNIQKASQKMDAAMQDTEKEIKKVVEQTEKLQKSTDQQSKQLDDSAKSLNKLSKEYNENAQAQKEAKIAAESLGNSIIDQKKKIKLLQAEYDSLDPTIEGNEQKMKQLSKQLVRTRTDVKKLSDASKRMNATFDDSEGSYNSLIQQNKRISQILRKLPPEFLQTNKRAQELKNTFNQNTEALKKFDKELGQNFRNVGNYGDSLGKLNGIAAGGMKALGALGLAGAVAMSAKELFEATKQLEKNQKVMQKLLNVGGKDLEVYTAKASAVAKVFDQEFNMVARATNVLMENFGQTGTESLDIIEQALIRGADIQDDFLEQLSEYSLFFKEAGLNAQNMVDVMLKGENKGIFSDKALDAVKEASIRIREMPQATKDAIDALGISSDKLQKGLSDGSITVADAIAKVSTEMGKLPEQSSIVGTAIADIFGGAGEDAGLAFLLTLKDINSESDDWKDNLSEAQKATQNLLESQTNLNSELLGLGTSFETTGNQLKSFFNNILAESISLLSGVIDGFNSTETVLINFRKQLKASEDVAVLTDEMNKLKKEIEDPSLWEQFKRGILGAGVAAKSITEDFIKINEIQKRIEEINKKAADKEIEVTKKVNATKTKEDQELARKKREAARELAKFELETQIKLLEETKANQEASLSERLAASDLIAEKQIEIAQISKDGRLDVEKALLKEEIELIKAQFDRIESEAIKAGEDFADALFKGLSDKAEDGILTSADFDKGISNRLTQLETARNQELKIIEESNMSFEDMERARFDVEEKFRKKSIESELAAIKKKIALAELSEEQKINALKRVSEIELELSKKTQEQKEIDLMQFGEAFASVTQAILNARASNFDAELTEIDQRIEASANFYDNEISLAGNNEVVKQEINRRRIADENKLNRERNKILRDQAKAQKRAALFGAIVNIAQGVATALNNPYPANLLFAASVAAVGAIEISTIKNEPLPAFAKGTKNAPGGLALVGEEGREIVYDKKTGTAGITPDKPSLMYVPKGAEVFDAKTSQRMMSNPEELENNISLNQTNKNIALSNASLQNNKDKYLRAMAAQNRPHMKIDYERLGKTVAKNIPPAQIWEIGNDNRIRSFTRNQDGSKTEHKNKEAEFISHKNPIAKEIKDIKKRLDKINN